ncbi:MAG: aldehyde dehydrogenase family protein [Planctomycetota bacterium]|nr:aldehyde dehydrogenase family protein [Planctomycetota bacterium]
MADVAQVIAQAREAQAAWGAASIDARLAVLRRAREAIAKHARAFAQTLGDRPGRALSETYTAEIVTLGDCALHLERNARHLLAPKRVGRAGRPMLAMGLTSEIHREPLGVVLVIAPSNYPIFLPGAQALQALAAGNACVLKPAPNCSAPAQFFARLLADAGLDARLIPVLDEGPEAAQAAIEAGVDKVVLTGSAQTGAKVLAALAPRLTPSVMELSGCDAVLVLAGADLDLTVRALRWGLRLNAGATCIGPRRVFVEASEAAEFERRMAEAVAGLAPVAVPEAVAAKARALLDEALAQGAKLLVPGREDFGRAEAFKPALLSGVAPACGLGEADLFAPVLSIMSVRDEAGMLEACERSAYALGASIFGPEARARELAGRVRAGSVSINDLIAPTADPRLPFGGRGRSGFGVTRGDEGLLEMTAVKCVSVRGGSFRPHYDDPRPEDVELFQTYLDSQHAETAGARWKAWMALLAKLMKRR